MNKKYIYIILIFILLDITKINHLWGENIHRRSTHHHQASQFNPNKIPWIKFLTNTLKNNEIDYINNIKNKVNSGIQTISPMMSFLLGGNYSNKKTLYYNDFEPMIQKELDRIGNRIKPQLEKLCGEKLELGNGSFRCVLLRYEGPNAEFTCHYDTEPYNCYRTLFLVKEFGKIPPFTYYNKDGKKIDKKLSVGDGLFFKGTQTYHCVGKSDDKNMKRYMIGWQYSTDNNIKAHSFCSMLRSQSMSNISITLLPYFLICIIITRMMKYYNLDKIDRKNLIFISLCVSLFAIMDPLRNNKNIGTGIKFTSLTLFKLIVMCLVFFLDINIGLMFYNYLIITEMTLPRQLLITANTGMFRN